MANRPTTLRALEDARPVARSLGLGRIRAARGRRAADVVGEILEPDLHPDRPSDDGQDSLIADRPNTYSTRERTRRRSWMMRRSRAAGGQTPDGNWLGPEWTLVHYSGDLGRYFTAFIQTDVRIRHIVENHLFHRPPLPAIDSASPTG